MNDWSSVTAGTKSRSTLRNVRTNVHIKSAVIRIPDQCQQRRIFECHGRSMNAGSVSRNSGSFRLGSSAATVGSVLMREWKELAELDGLHGMEDLRE
jgi:hypothetical protein